MPKSRRILDISPPKSKEEMSQEKKQHTKRKKKNVSFRKVPMILVFGVFLIGGILLAGALVAQFVFSSSTIIVWPHSRALNLQANFEVRADQASIDLAQNIIPGKIFEQEKSATKLYPATGVRANETKAQGIITVFNNQEKAQILVPTTRFMSQDGKLFRSMQRVIVDPKSSQNVSVVAAETGNNYNIGASTFSLPGLAGTVLYTLVYGKSSQAMQGGSKTQIPIVTKRDIELAKSALLDTITKVAKDALQKQIVAPYALDDASIHIQVEQANSLVSEGAQLAQFSVLAKVKLIGLAFQKANAEELAKNVLQNEMVSTEAINIKSLQITYTSKNFDLDKNSLSFGATITAMVYQAVDQNELIQGVMGQKKVNAEAFLSEYPQLTKFQVALWPFWVQTIPNDAKRTHINVSLDAQ